jgi:hypothetical protein
MSDREKFEGFKQKLIDDNESKYGKKFEKSMAQTQLMLHIRNKKT